MARRVASTISGPVPSPGMSVMVCVRTASPRPLRAQNRTGGGRLAQGLNRDYRFAREGRAMIRTRLTQLLSIRHPIVLGGMSGATGADLVAAVSEAGGLGTLGVSSMTAEEIRAAVETIRARTSRPFGLNLLLFTVNEDQINAVVAARPRVIATAWPRPEDDLSALAKRAHASGAVYIHQVDTVGEATRAAEAGADAIVAQGTEGGGHVGVMATLPLARMVIRAVPKIPVVVAGG